MPGRDKLIEIVQESVNDLMSQGEHLIHAARRPGEYTLAGIDRHAEHAREAVDKAAEAARILVREGD